MKTIKDFPPNYDEICSYFDIRGKKTVVFTYGDILYNPGGLKVPDHLKVHEKTHVRQQGANPEGWWNKYLLDPQFRIGQEVEAYQNQYRFFVRTRHNLPEREKFLTKIAGDLSGPIYGNIIDFEMAKRLISQ